MPFLHEDEEFVDNRPRAIRCVHPLVTLIDKIDAVSRGYRREPFESARFVRHYEDAARILRGEVALPDAGMTPRGLLDVMVAEKDVRERPRSDSPALTLADTEKRRQLEEAHTAIGRMFWGERITLGDSTGAIRDWLDRVGSAGASDR